jgi:hypothetical protein
MIMEGNDLASIKAMLTQMIDKQNEMDYMLRDMDKTLTQLNQTVIGNPTYNQKGLVSEINEIKEYVETDKRFKNKVVGGLAVVGFIWTIAIEYVMHLFKK